jgi:hypothetical protein
VKNAPTYFGPLSLTVNSQAAPGGIIATIAPPTRQRPQALVIRLRHPQEKPMRSVQVNGRLWQDFEGLLKLLPNNRLKARLPDGTQQLYRWVNDLDYQDDEGRRHKVNALLLEETYDHVYERHRAMAEYTQRWARKHFALFPEPGYESITVTCVQNTPGKSVKPNFSSICFSKSSKISVPIFYRGLRVNMLD